MTVGRKGGLIAVGIALIALGQPVSAQQREVPVESEVFLATFRAVIERHLNAPSTSDLWASAAQGLLEALQDPYAALLTPDQTKREKERMTGNFAGIGAEMTTLSGLPMFRRIFPDSPAERAGVLPGDHVEIVGDTPTDSLALDEVVQLIRGPAGTSVDLTLRGPDGAVRTTKVTRAPVHVPSVVAARVNDGVLYVRIEQFGDSTAGEFLGALTTETGYKALILDLRGNAGGYQAEAVSIGDMLLPRGSRISSARYRAPGAGVDEQVFTSRHEPVVGEDTPMVVLVDETTASASEILAAALQDNGRARIIGTPTFGKGLVQSLMQLPGDWQLKFTVGEWTTASGRSIHRFRDANGKPEPVTDTALVPTRQGRMLMAHVGIQPDDTVEALSVSEDLRAFAGILEERSIELGQMVRPHALRLARTAGGPTDEDLDRAKRELQNQVRRDIDRKEARSRDVGDLLSWLLGIEVFYATGDVDQEMSLRTAKDPALLHALSWLEASRVLQRP